MRQLLLNSLFIVGSAFVYIQGVKLITATDKINKTVIPGYLKPSSTKPQKHNGVFIKNNDLFFRLNLKNGVLDPFLHNPAFTYNMMSYVNYRSVFYNPYTDLGYYGLASNYYYRLRNKK
jgi:hypothetical protein